MKRDLPENQPTLLKPWEVVHPHSGDGRVTDLAGNPIHLTTEPRA